MAAKEDKSKTSKTARVMNLLSKKGNSTPASGETEAAAEGVNLPPIIASLEPDTEVSGQIKDALEDVLAHELGESPEQEETQLVVSEQEETEPELPQSTEAVEESPVQAEPEASVQEEASASQEPPVSVQEPAPAAEAPIPAEIPAETPVEAPVQAEAPVEAPVQAEAPVEAPVQAEAPVEAPVQAEAPVEAPVRAEAPVEVSVQAETPEPPSALQELEKFDASYVNVMQVLVEEKAEKYVKLFGLCQCERCLNDVKALALNHLPPKYVVMDPGERIPKLTFYEGRYESEITTQLVQACKAVLSRPHHTR